MSGLDPLAAFAAQIVANAQAAIEEAALDLGAATQAFQAQLSVGDILTATVLPPENGSDRLSVLGQTIAARLPSGVNPGEQLQLQVTGFTSAAIIVRNLGVIDPNNPPPQPNIQVPAQNAPQTAVLRSAPPPAPAPPATAPANAAPPPPEVSLAPPREIFVAASVVPTAAPNAQAPASAEPPAPASAAGALEARIALNRTPLPQPAAKAAPAPASAPAPAASTPSARTAAASSPAAAPRPIAAPHPAAAAPPPMTARPAAASESVAPRTVRAPSTPEAALLARVRVPATATTLAAARIVKSATQALTSAFERLDAQLAKLAPDSRVGTLRSLLSFVGELDLRAPATLPEQLAAFVSHVLDGAEGKFVQLARAVLAAPQEPASASAGPHAAAASPAPSTVNLPEAPALAPASNAASAAAHVAERTAAYQHDVKAVLLALTQSSPRDASPNVIQALRDALVATTAVQVNVLSSQANDPNAITIPLPAYFFEGGKPTQLRIARDPSGNGRALDADNFHLGFVLDTKTLGTVAIDVQTVGRAVSIDVKTQTSTFAERFRGTLGELRARLEALRYRVAALDAGAAPAGQTANVPADFDASEAPATRAERSSTWDMRA